MGIDNLSLYIEKGIKDRHTIKFDNAGDEHEDTGTSDMVF